MPASAGVARCSSRSATSGRALGQRAPAGGGEHARRPRVVLGFGGQQVRGHDAVERAVGGQQARRAPVQARALGPEVGLDDVADHRVHEAPFGGVDQVRAHQDLELGRRLLDRQRTTAPRRGGRSSRRPARRSRARPPDAPGESRRMRAVTVRATVPGTVVRTAAASSARPENDVARSSSVSSSGLPAVVSKQASTNAGDASIRAAPARRRPRPTAARAQQHGRGRGREPVEQRLLGARLGRPRGHRQQHRQVLDAAGERVEEAQARRVRPVGVVDDHQQRLLGRRGSRTASRARRASCGSRRRRRRRRRRTPARPAPPPPRTAARAAPASHVHRAPRRAAARSRTRSRAPAARRSRSARAGRLRPRACAAPAAAPSCPARRGPRAARPTRRPRVRRQAVRPAPRARPRARAASPSATDCDGRRGRGPASPR